MNITHRTNTFPQNPEFGTSEAFSEAQLKIAESEESIRQVAVSVTRAEARLAALRAIGVDVSRWLEKAQEKAQEKHTSEPGGEHVMGDLNFELSQQNLSSLFPP